VGITPSEVNKLKGQIHPSPFYTNQQDGASSLPRRAGTLTGILKAVIPGPGKPLKKNSELFCETKRLHIFATI
jgi:hypothetical protein